MRPLAGATLLIASLLAVSCAPTVVRRPGAPLPAAPVAPGPTPRPAIVPPELLEQLTRLAGELRDLQNAMARVVATHRAQEERLAVVEGRLTELAARTRVGPNSTPAAAGPPEARPTLPPSPAVSSAPERFEAGLAKLEAGEGDAAILLLSEVVADHPSHPLRQRAQVLLADIYYGQRRYRAALGELESLLAAAPKAAPTADVWLKIGLCRRALGDETGAARAWERLIAEHPQTEAARQARRLLRAGPSH